MVNPGRTKEKELQGNALEKAVLADEQFVQESIEGFQQIEAGKNSVVTLEELRESLKNGKPLF